MCWEYTSRHAQLSLAIFVNEGLNRFLEVAGTSFFFKDVNPKDILPWKAEEGSH
jgi:hypothetical protein